MTVYRPVAVNFDSLLYLQTLYLQANDYTYNRILAELSVTNIAYLMMKMSDDFIRERDNPCFSVYDDLTEYIVHTFVGADLAIEIDKANMLFEDVWNRAEDTLWSVVNNTEDYKFTPINIICERTIVFEITQRATQ